jgi:hypothetical protein
MCWGASGWICAADLEGTIMHRFFVGVVQVAVMEVVDVIAVANGLVSAAWAMNVAVVRVVSVIVVAHSRILSLMLLSSLIKNVRDG